MYLKLYIRRSSVLEFYTHLNSILTKNNKRDKYYLARTERRRATSPPPYIKKRPPSGWLMGVFSLRKEAEVEPGDSWWPE